MTARQQALTARLRCYYSAPARRAERPHCDGVGAVAYGSSVLCPSCDKMRSAVGRTGTAHQLPGAELAELMAAATELSGAEERVVRALRNARRAGASWPRWGRARHQPPGRTTALRRGGPTVMTHLPSLYRGRRLPRGIACLLSAGPEPRREEVSFRG